MFESDADDVLLERSIQLTLAAVAVLFFAAAFSESVDRQLMMVFRLLLSWPS